MGGGGEWGGGETQIERERGKEKAEREGGCFDEGEGGYGGGGGSERE